uniref:DNA (cytosine-5-)-methyltransferase n=1 Tax=Macrostomum lignano TaxID=282301 RepID=A0A1I8HW68_9PLAT
TETHKTETSQDRNFTRPKLPKTETSQDRNFTRPKLHKTETSQDRNFTRPKLHKTETSQDRNFTRPKLHKTETSQDRNFTRPKLHKTETSQDRNFTRPKLHKTETSQDRNFTRPKLHKTETSQDRNFTRPKLHKTETSQDRNFTRPKLHKTETSQDRNFTRPKLHKTETSQDRNFTRPKLHKTETSQAAKILHAKGTATKAIKSAAVIGKPTTIMHRSTAVEAAFQSERLSPSLLALLSTESLGFRSGAHRAAQAAHKHEPETRRHRLRLRSEVEPNRHRRQQQRRRRQHHGRRDERRHGRHRLRLGQQAVQQQQKHRVAQHDCDAEAQLLSRLNGNEEDEHLEQREQQQGVLGNPRLWSFANSSISQECRSNGNRFMLNLQENSHCPIQPVDTVDLLGDTDVMNSALSLCFDFLSSRVKLTGWNNDKCNHNGHCGRTAQENHQPLHGDRCDLPLRAPFTDVARLAHHGVIGVSLRRRPAAASPLTAQHHAAQAAHEHDPETQRHRLRLRSEVEPNRYRRQQQRRRRQHHGRRDERRHGRHRLRLGQQAVQQQQEHRVAQHDGDAEAKLLSRLDWHEEDEHLEQPHEHDPETRRHRLRLRSEVEPNRHRRQQQRRRRQHHGRRDERRHGRHRLRLGQQAVQQQQEHRVAQHDGDAEAQLLSRLDGHEEDEHLEQHNVVEGANNVEKKSQGVTVTQYPESKTTAVMFTNKLLWTIKPLALYGKDISMEKHVRGLGLTLDHRLNWTPHIQTKAKKALAVLAQIRRASALSLCFDFLSSRVKLTGWNNDKCNHNGHCGRTAQENHQPLHGDRCDLPLRAPFTDVARLAHHGVIGVSLRRRPAAASPLTAQHHAAQAAHEHDPETRRHRLRLRSKVEPNRHRRQQQRRRRQHHGRRDERRHGRHRLRLGQQAVQQQQEHRVAQHDGDAEAQLLSRLDWHEEDKHLEQPHEHDPETRRHRLRLRSEVEPNRHRRQQQRRRRQHHGRRDERRHGRHRLRLGQQAVQQQQEHRVAQRDGDAEAQLLSRLDWHEEDEHLEQHDYDREPELVAVPVHHCDISEQLGVPDQSLLVPAGKKHASYCHALLGAVHGYNHSWRGDDVYFHLLVWVERRSQFRTVMVASVDKAGSRGGGVVGRSKSSRGPIELRKVAGGRLASSSHAELCVPHFSGGQMARCRFCSSVSMSFGGPGILVGAQPENAMLVGLWLRLNHWWQHQSIIIFSSSSDGDTSSLLRDNALKNIPSRWQLSFSEKSIVEIWMAKMQAMMPTTTMAARIDQMTWRSVAVCQKIGFITLRANMEAAERIELSAEDITAAETTPKPTKATAGGQRYCRTSGRISFMSSLLNGVDWNALKIHLPGYAAKGEHQKIIGVVSGILRCHGAQPAGLFGAVHNPSERCGCDGLHQRVHHGERNGEPLMRINRPENFAKQSRHKQQAAHSLAVLVLERVQHGHVAPVRTGCRPENFAKQSRHKQQAAHSLAVLVLERVQHGHVAPAASAQRFQAEFNCLRCGAPGQGHPVAAVAVAVHYSRVVSAPPTDGTSRVARDQILEASSGQGSVDQLFGWRQPPTVTMSVAPGNGRYSRLSVRVVSHDQPHCRLGQRGNSALSWSGVRVATECASCRPVWAQFLKIFDAKRPGSHPGHGLAIQLVGNHSETTVRQSVKQLNCHRPANNARSEHCHILKGSVVPGEAMIETVLLYTVKTWTLMKLLNPIVLNVCLRNTFATSRCANYPPPHLRIAQFSHFSCCYAGLMLLIMTHSDVILPAANQREGVMETTLERRLGRLYKEAVFGMRILNSARLRVSSRPTVDLLSDVALTHSSIGRTSAGPRSVTAKLSLAPQASSPIGQRSDTAQHHQHRLIYISASSLQRIAASLRGSSLERSGRKIQLRVVLTDISKSVKQSAAATSSKSAADRLAELRPDCSILLPAGKTTSQSVNDDPNADGKDDCENEDIGRLVWARWQRQSYPALVVSGRRCHLRPARPGMRWLLWLAEGKVSELPVSGLQSIDNPQSLAAAMTSSAQKNSLLVRGVRRLRLELIERRDESFQKSDGATGSSGGSAIGQDLAQLAAEDEAARKRRQPLLSDWATDCLVDIYKQHRKSLGAVAENSDDDEAAASRSQILIYEKVLDGSIALENVCLACGTVRVEQQLPLLMEHPVLRGSLCVDCLENYLTVCFSVGDDGWFMYCSVCGRPGNQAMCGSAECGRCFCQGCLTLLIGQDAWQRIISDNGWLCHLCQLLSERLIQPRSDWRQRLYYQTEPHSLHPPPPPELQRSACCSQPLRVLSLFDGVASALLCLQSAGLSVEICFASEIDPDAIRVAACNHGNRVRQLGSVTELTEDRLRSLLPIDLLIGGSPCSQLSAANPNR